MTPLLAILLGSLLAFAVVYLIAQFVHGLRDFDIDDLEPLFGEDWNVKR